jgi:glycosyltransferase involved in cell wall biosynthesis
MRVLLVGFQPLTRITYPHLKQVTQYLLSRGGEYVLFRERGYFLDESLQPGFSLRAWVNACYALFTLCVDTARLLVKRVHGDFDIVVAVDNFAYLVAARLFRNVVLWSHDFVSDDQPRSKAWIHRLIRRWVLASLDGNPALIIQDPVRLGVFCKRYRPGGPASLDTFFLPVSLLPSPGKMQCPPRARPVLLQIGGINSHRSMSDLLLEHYQLHPQVYELVFHGYIDKEMVRRIQAAEFMPWASALAMPPDDVHKAVAKCDIGLIAYVANDLNFFHIAKASGQLVEYLRCGRPVIVMGNTDLKDLVERERIGVAMEGVEQLVDAIQAVMADYEAMSANANRLYAAEYDLSNFLEPLAKWLRMRGMACSH